MRIAVGYDDKGRIYEPFSSCPRFKIYDIDNRRIDRMTIFDTSDASGRDLIAALAMQGVTILLTDTIEKSPYDFASNNGVMVIAGVKGSADAAVIHLIDGELKHDPGSVRSESSGAEELLLH